MRALLRSLPLLTVVVIAGYNATRWLGLGHAGAALTGALVAIIGYPVVLDIRDRHRLRHPRMPPVCGQEDPGQPRCTRLLVRGQCLRHGARP